MGLHTGEPSVGEEGYLGLDVVRAARICSAGHGGQILLSETTRALLGNELPEGVAVVDLGQQHLKDVQHERIYQLAIDGDQSFPPLKTDAPKSASDELGDRIARHVEEMIAKSFNPAESTRGKSKAQVDTLRYGQRPDSAAARRPHDRDHHLAREARLLSGPPGPTGGPLKRTTRPPRTRAPALPPARGRAG